MKDSNNEVVGMDLQALYSYLISEANRNRNIFWNTLYLCIVLMLGLTGLKLQGGISSSSPYSESLFKIILPIIIVLICVVGSHVLYFIGKRHGAFHKVLIGLEQDSSFYKIFRKHFPKWVTNKIQQKPKRYKIRGVDFALYLPLWVMAIITITLLTDGMNLLGIISILLGYGFFLLISQKRAEREAANELLEHCHMDLDTKEKEEKQERGEGEGMGNGVGTEL